MAVAEGVNELFIVLPTGASKNLTFMLPAMQKQAHTTMVITLLAALAKDLVKRCKHASTDTVIYRNEHTGKAAVIIIVTETIIRSSCRQQCSQYQLTEYKYP